MSDRNDFIRRYNMTSQTHVSHARKISILMLYFTEIDVKEINKWKVEKFLSLVRLQILNAMIVTTSAIFSPLEISKKLRSDIPKSFYMLLRSRSPQGKQYRDSLHIISHPFLKVHCQCSRPTSRTGPLPA